MYSGVGGGGGLWLAKGITSFMLFDAVFEWVGEFFLSTGSEEFVNT